MFMLSIVFLKCYEGRYGFQCRCKESNVEGLHEGISVSVGDDDAFRSNRFERGKGEIMSLCGF